MGGFTLHDTASTPPAPGDRPLPVYPLLAAIFPVLSVYSASAARVSPADLLLPLAFVCVLSAAVWIVLLPVLRARHARALAAFYLLLLFWAYGALLDAYRALLQNKDMLSLRQAAPVLILAVGTALVLVVVLRRSARSFRPVTRFMNLLFSFALAAALLNAAWAWRGAGSGREAVGSLEARPIDQENLPDIIYIIPDAYGRHDVLHDLYDHDNEPFVRRLEERGFYVARESNANYNYTRFSVASSLNFRYVTDDAFELGGATLPADLIRNNRLVPFLKDHGYEIIGFATGYSDTELRDADRYLKPRVVLTEFHNLLINATPLRSILNRVRARKISEHGKRFGQYDLHRDRIRFTLDSLKSLGAGERPRFVLAHIISPHWPFVLDENADPIYPTIRYDLSADFPSWEAPSLDEFTVGYARQVQGLNKILLETIDAVLAERPNTVIIIQGDHGPRRRSIDPDPGDWTAYAEEELAILNAYYFPQTSYEGLLYPTISPVNTFRVLLTHYLDADLPLLDDEPYFYDEPSGRLFHSVTHDPIQLQP